VAVGRAEFVDLAELKSRYIRTGRRDRCGGGAVAVDEFGAFGQSATRAVVDK
jgi:hypothetical protein